MTKTVDGLQSEATSEATSREAQAELDREAQAVQTRLDIVREFSRELAEEVQQLERKVRAARGTEPPATIPIEAQPEIAPEPAADMKPIPDMTFTVYPPPTPPAPSLEHRIERHLRHNIASTVELARVTGRTVDDVGAALANLRPRAHNLGSAELPKWIWLPNGYSSQELRDLVRRVISHQPMELRELVAVTGVREGLVAGHLTELRRSDNVVDLGSPYRGRWFIMPSTARDARLAPPRTNRRNDRD